MIEEQAQADVAQKQAKRLPKSQVTELYLRKPQLLSAEAKVKSSLADLKRARRDLENCNIVARSRSRFPPEIPRPGVR